MTGQLNTSLISDLAVEEEIDCLDSRVTAVESDVATNKTNIEAVADSLSSYKSSQSDKVTTTNVKATTVDASTVKSTAVNATCATATQATINTLCNTTLNGNIISAQSVSAPNVAAETVSSTNVNADSITTDELKSTGDVVGSVGTFTTIDATNVIAGNVKADSISGTVTGNVTAPTLTATTANINNLTIDCSTTANNITANGDITASGNIKSATINADCGTIPNFQSTNACIDNVIVCNKLTLCGGVIDATFGDATADSLTADNITVNGDAAITGKATVGAITSTGAVVGSEYCNGTKGVVIDKDSNIAAAAITADTVTASTINATDGTSNLDQVCITTVTTCNEFVTNFYPTNITIDKDVGDLHYSRQLDTDNTGNVLVDCKNVYPKSVKCTCCYTQSYCDKEGYLKTSGGHLNQYKRLGGICLDTYACRDCMCTAAKYTNHIRLYTCINDTYDEKIPGCDSKFCDTKGFDIVSVDHDSTSSSPDTLTIKAFGKNSSDILLALTYCRDNNCKNFYVSTPTTFECESTFLCPVNLSCVPYCSTAQTCVLALDSNNNIVSQQIKTSLIACDCKYTTNNNTTCMNCTTQTLGYACRYNVCCSYSNNNTCCINLNCKSMLNNYNNDCIYYYCRVQNGSTWNSTTCNCLNYDNLSSTCRMFNVCHLTCSCSNDCFSCDYTQSIAAKDLFNNTSTTSLHKICCSYWPSCSECNQCSQHLTYFYNSLLPMCSAMPSYAYRCSYSYNSDGVCSFDDTTSWLLCIYDKNLYLQTQFGGTDILRVEDGKIYTKCGEFTSGSSSAQTEYTCDNYNITKCVDNTPTVENNSITLSTINYCSICSCPTKTWTCVGHSISKSESLDKTEILYKVYCTGSSTDVVNNYCYRKSTTCTILPSSNVLQTCALDENCYTCSGCEYLATTAHYQLEPYNPSFTVYGAQGELQKCYCFSKSSIVDFCNGGLHIADSQCDFSGYLFLDYYTGHYASSCIAYTSSYYKKILEPFEGQYCCKRVCDCCCFSDLDFNNNISKCFTSFGEESTMQSCCCDDSHFEATYAYSPIYSCLSIRQGCGCEYSNEYDGGAYEKCCELTCGTCWNICYSGVDNCYTAYHTDGSSFIYKNRIDATGLKESFNDLCVKTTCLSKNIADLPVTNAMVPLAGVVNNNGFAFFCKTDSAITFYDGNFDIVDAGTCASICYISTVGSM